MLSYPFMEACGPYYQNKKKGINTLKEAITLSTSLEELSQKVERSVTKKLRKDYEDTQDFINRWKEEQKYLKKER